MKVITALYDTILPSCIDDFVASDDDFVASGDEDTSEEGSSDEEKNNAVFAGGIDSSALAIEWVMTELLNHPEVLKTVKEELDTQIEKDCLVEDLSKLPYLQNVISETLRLHTLAPLLLPHYSSEDCIIGGYNIPKDTIVLTNAWLIHRDPKYWNDPTSFKPERFEKEGEIHKLIGFGLGRRACPGLGLAQRTVCFEWKRESEKKLDMTDEYKGTTMHLKIPFQAMCKPLPIFNDVMK